MRKVGRNAEAFGGSQSGFVKRDAETNEEKESTASNLMHTSRKLLLRVS